MTHKFPILFVLFFGLLIFSSCYTVTYPEPCPGLAEVELNSETENEIALTY